MNIGEFIIKIGTKGDTKALDSAIAKMSTAEKKSRRLSNYLNKLKQATTEAQKALIKKNFAQQVELDNLKSISGKQKDFNVILKNGISSALKMATAIGVTVAALDRMGNSLLKANQLYTTFGKQTGISINRLNKMVGLARLSGMNLAPEQVAGDLQSLQQKIFRFTRFGEGADIFGQLGINPMGMRPENIILRLRKSLRNYAPEVKSYFLDQLGLSQEWLNVLDLADKDFQEIVIESSKLQLDAKERSKLAKYTLLQQKNNMRWELARQKLLIQVMPLVQKIMEAASTATLAFSRWLEQNPKWINVLRDVLILFTGAKFLGVIRALSGVAKTIGTMLGAIGLGKAAGKAAAAGGLFGGFDKIKKLFGTTGGKGLAKLGSKKGLAAVGGIIAKRLAVGIGALAGGPLGAIFSIALAVWTIVDIFNLFMKKEEEKDNENFEPVDNSETRYQYHNVKSNMTNNFYNNPQPVHEIYSELGEVEALLVAEKNR